MNRREFNLGALISALLVRSRMAKALHGRGGSSGGDGSPSAADADFEARTAAPSVVWYHNFLTVAELNQFRTSHEGGVWGTTSIQIIGGNDPANGGYNTLSYLAAGSVGLGSGGAIRAGIPNGFYGWPSGTWMEPTSSADGYVHFPAGTTFVGDGSGNGYGGTFTFPDTTTFHYVPIVGDSSGSSNYPNTLGWAASNANGAWCWYSGEHVISELRTTAGGWERPLSPLTGACNGRGVDDPGAGGSITVLSTWDPTNPTEDYNWNDSWYGYPAYQTGSGVGWEGSEYWFQCRTRLPATRFTTRTDPTGGSVNTDVIVTASLTYIAAGTAWSPPGKIWFIDDFNNNGNARQELILECFTGYSQQNYGGDGAPFAWYGNNQIPITEDGFPGISGGNQAETATLYPLCNWENSPPLQCLWWEPDSWCTILVHVIPGVHNLAAFQATLTTSGALTVTNSDYGALAIGQYIYGTNVPSGCQITAGSGTSWTVSPAPASNISAEYMSASTENGNQTTFEYSVQLDTDWEYTRLGSITEYHETYGSGPKGWQNINLTAYMNTFMAWFSAYHDYAQPIFAAGAAGFIDPAAPVGAAPPGYF